jgi:hypothetical protein
MRDHLSGLCGKACVRRQVARILSAACGASVFAAGPLQGW